MSNFNEANELASELVFGRTYQGNEPNEDYFGFRGKFANLSSDGLSGHSLTDASPRLPAD